MNSRLLAVLVLGLVASSLFLVRTSYESRRLFAELDRARVEQRRLDAEFKRLDAEAQAQATHLRVEKVAREKLHMRTASPAITDRVEDAGAPGGPTSLARAGTRPAAIATVASVTSPKNQAAGAGTAGAPGAPGTPGTPGVLPKPAPMKVSP